MNSPTLRKMTTAALLLCLCSLAILTNRVSGADAPPSARYALLIGCSDYQHLPGKNLRGPKNDVKEFALTLITRFGFAPMNIRQLVGWPDEKNANLRPTRENILKELDQLAEKSADGVQIVIAFSGHGTRIPIPENQNPLDPKNPEPDGFDEAFVAADARLVGDEMQNLILDDELGVRLQKLRAGGAQVWALFDCCHSGTMSRGGGDEAVGEVSRELSAVALGVPAAKVARAEAKAADVKIKTGETNDAVNIFDAPATATARGSFVAFYAAQPFETAPDLPCPPNAPKTDDHYFGLLTYSTLQTLLRERPAGRMTYRELGQAIIGRYRAERGTRGPTPNFAGDLDREVLGMKTWPGRSQMLLQKNGASWIINAGELQGLSTGSVLALYPPATTATEGQMPIGYVRVLRATPTTADVEPCPHEKVPALATGQMQEAMRCEIVSRQLGDLRLKLFVPDSAPELSAAVGLVGDYVKIVDDAAADWRMLTVTPPEALRDYQLTLAGPRVLLIRNGELALSNAAPLASDAKPLGRVWQQYDPRAAAAFRTALAADLQKVFTWQNLWRVAGGLGKELADANCDVKVELAALAGANDPTGGKLLTNATVVNGDYLELRVANDGVDRVWVTLVFLDADFRVVVLPTQQLNRPGAAGDALQPIRFQIAAKTPGPQSWLVIATSAEADRLEPDFQFLAQSGLGKTPKKALATERAGGSPFETLALAVAGQKGAFRGTVAPSAKNPTLLLRSWLAAPAKSKP